MQTKDIGDFKIIRIIQNGAMSLQFLISCLIWTSFQAMLVISVLKPANPRIENIMRKCLPVSNAMPFMPNMSKATFSDS